MSSSGNADTRLRKARAGASTRSILWLTVSAIALLVAMAILALAVVSRALEEARESHAAAERTRNVLSTVNRVLSALKDAETAERGFVITGNDAFLEPYRAARRTLSGDLEHLRASALDAQGRSAIEELVAASARQFSFIEQVIDVRRAKGKDIAEALIGRQTGRRRMDYIRDLVDRIRAREEAMLAARLETFRAQSARSETIARVGLVAAILFVLLAGGLLVRHTRSRLWAEKSASEAHATLEATIDQVSQGIAVFDEQRRLVVWNDQYATLRGLPPEEVRAHVSLADLVRHAAPLESADPHPNGGQVVPELLHAAGEFDLEARRADGAVLLVRGRPMPNRGYLVTLLDVTAMKRSEAAYRDQATRLTAILDNVVDAIVTINESGSIESWSKGAERLFGYQAHEVLRRNVKMLMPEPHRSAHDGYLRRYLQTGERRAIGHRREVEALTKSGQRVAVDLGISELQLGDRRLFIGIVRDISARLEVERLKAGFVSTVSHELRTPLTSIAGSLGLLAGGVAGELPPKASRLIDIAKLNSERLVLLINDILDLERAESDRLELRLEPQPLLPIVQQAIELNRSYAHNFGVSIDLDPRTQDAKVLVDRDRLIQVLTNLLSNAAKFSPRGGVVIVSVELDDDRARVSVRDNGPGISPQFAERIFERFAQADSSDSRAKGGTGLGLSIAKAIMQKLGGEIDFESEPGAGSVFYITLPVRQEARAYVRREVARGAVPHVLICEDDPDIARVFDEVLQSEGIRVHIVSTAKEARVALAANKFDMALIDLHLPDVEGLELITELRAAEATRALPIIVMTASGRAVASSPEICALELADWLQKPIDPKRLLDAIRNVLAQHGDGRARILHVEDDESLTQLVRELLDEECDVTSVHTLAAAQLAVRNREYDLVILDIGLGDGSGLDVLPLLRRDSRPAPPVILYSASEASREISELVEAALVKSRHPVEQLLESVRTLASRAS